MTMLLELMVVHIVDDGIHFIFLQMPECVTKRSLDPLWPARHGRGWQWWIMPWLWRGRRYYSKWTPREQFIIILCEYFLWVDLEHLFQWLMIMISLIGLREAAVSITLEKLSTRAASRPNQSVRWPVAVLAREGGTNWRYSRYHGAASNVTNKHIVAFKILQFIKLKNIKNSSTPAHFEDRWCIGLKVGWQATDEWLLPHYNQPSRQEEDPWSTLLSLSL